MPGRLMELKDAADLNEIIIGDTTRRLVWGAVELRASAAPGAWQVVTFDPEADPIERQFGAPLVGRASEVARLREAFDWMRRTESCHLVTVLGSAGIGKSRLARELAALVDDEATVLTGRPAGDGGAVFAPLA